MRPGDTLSGLAAGAGVSVADMAAMNGLDPDGILVAGAPLKLPSGAAAPAQSSAPAPAQVVPAADPAPTAKAPTSAMTGTPPVVPARLMGLDLGPACQQCGGMMQRTGSCYTCSSCGNNTGCG